MELIAIVFSVKNGTPEEECKEITEEIKENLKPFIDYITEYHDDVELKCAW